MLFFEFKKNMNQQKKYDFSYKNILPIAGQSALILWIYAWWVYTAIRNKSLLYVYPSLFQSWTVSFCYFPWLDMIYAAVAMIVFFFMGHLLLSCFEIFIPRSAHLALSFVLGLCIVTWVGQLCGLATLFYGWAILIALIISIFVLIYFITRQRYKSLDYTSDSADDYYIKSGRIDVARKSYKKTIIPAQTITGKIFAFSFISSISIIVFLTFYHGLLFPITYWDSLSYLGMARKLVLEHKFPVCCQAQMGIGTGSNYPWMYRLASAVPSVIAGKWSDAYARMLAPLCGLISILLLYHTALRISRDKLAALSISLLFCSLPYGIRYFTFTSDYSFCILFTAAFMYTSFLYLDTNKKSYLILSGIISAFACNINYLMPLLLFGWFFLLLISRKRKTNLTDNEEYSEQIVTEEMREMISDPDFTREEKTPSLIGLIRSPFYIKLMICFILIISPWYLRNIVLTGNPVYPYFSSIFGGQNINKKVIKSMQGEWLENGDGIETATINNLAEKIRNGKITEKSRKKWIAGNPEEDGLHFTLFGKLSSTFYYFVISRKWSWAFAPTFMSLAIPGIFIWAFIFLYQILKGARHPKSKRLIRGPDPVMKFGLLTLFILFSFFGYHYILAGYYIYQILPVLVSITIFAFISILVFKNRITRIFFYFWCLLVFFLPALPFGLMNFKRPSDLKLEAFREPGMHRDKYYSLVFGADMDMYEHINTVLKGKTLLTHDNRYLLYDPSINIIHLDDWEIQKAYDLKSSEKILKIFENLKIDYYLKIPMQEKHQILNKLRLDTWEEKGLLHKYFNAGGNTLYKINYLNQQEKQTQSGSGEVIIKWSRKE
jgi:4-amino-4-deoxy-L-arabinose transferase-like glycosyltransferase